MGKNSLTLQQICAVQIIEYEVSNHFKGTLKFLFIFTSVERQMKGEGRFSASSSQMPTTVKAGPECA